MCVSVHRWGSNVTITHDALDLTEQPPPPFPKMGTHWTGTPLLVVSDGQHWRPVQTCSLQKSPQEVLTFFGY